MGWSNVHTFPKRGELPAFRSTHRTFKARSLTVRATIYSHDDWPIAASERGPAFVAPAHSDAAMWREPAGGFTPLEKRTFRGEDHEQQARAWCETFASAWLGGE